MESNRLAEFFNKQREIIEAAETPFAKLAVFILPILAPIVPATFTGLHIFKLLLGVFTFSQAHNVSMGLSTIVAIVLEMLGYVGAISFIQSLFRWVRTRKDEYLLPFVLNGLAYVFYLVAMWLINLQLGKYFGTPDIVNNIVGLLSFITVPTSLLAANHLSQVEEREDATVIRRENREERLEKLRIKYGSSRTTSESNTEVSKDIRNTSGTMGRPSIHQERVFSFMEQQYSETQEIPTFTEVMHTLNLPQSTASRLRDKWIELKRIRQ